MLNIDLLRGKPALKTVFRFSLAVDLLHTISLLLESESVAGLHRWIYVTRAALPLDLSEDLALSLLLLNRSGHLYALLQQTPSEHPLHHDFVAFLAWLRARTPDEIRQWALLSLPHLCGCSADAGVDIADEAALRTAFAKKFDALQIERLLLLLREPWALKALFISALTRFWEQFYRQEYATCSPLRIRSVEHHRRQEYTLDWPSVIVAVTGRRLPKDYNVVEDIDRLVFIPSCYLGPYMTVLDFSQSTPTLLIHYNCRPTGVLAAEQISATQDLYPPLKALADETRLQILSLLDGGEMYAQEIVAALGISQSAVSRHLKLMVVGGVLNVRKEESMKYFSINTDLLTALAGKLEIFKEKQI